MKGFSVAVAWGFLVGGGLAADPIYQINFAGTITSGLARDFDPSTNSLSTAADLIGLPVSGWLQFDLGLAAVPVVSTDASGFINTVIQGSGPIFVSEHFAIDGLTIPSNFLPLPPAFDLAPIPNLPAGTTVSQTTDDQVLKFATKPDGAAQSLNPQMDLAYSWVGPQMSGSDIVSVILLISEFQQFFPVLPQGGIPPGWGPVPTTGSGVFNLSEFSQDPTMLSPAQHFGITTDYSLTGNFTVDSASGALVTPEPGTLWPTAILLLAIGARICMRQR